MTDKHKTPEQLAEEEFSKRTDDNAEGDYNPYEKDELVFYFIAGYEAGFKAALDEELPPLPEPPKDL